VEVLSSRLLLRPRDLERSLSFYGETLGLGVYREFGDGASRGVVFFLGGGFLEVSGPTRPEGPSAQSTAEQGSPAREGQLRLWLQVRDVDAAHEELRAKGVQVLQAPTDEPWGLREMWVADPDGLRIAVIEVPEAHPLRRRSG
jgi:catechol 2,3-dioxygenase-like lactoylglutathione lyase family enzyme